MSIRPLRFLFAVVPILLLCGIAHAQAAAGAPVDPASLLEQLLSFATTGHGMAASGVAMSLVVWLLRSGFASKWAFWKTKLGGYLLGYGVPMIAYLGLALVVPGAHVTLQLIGAAIAAGLAGAGAGRSIDHIVQSMSSSSGGGSATAKTAMRMAMLAGVALMLSSGCKAHCSDPKNAGSTECKVINGIVDCTGVSSLSTAVDELGPIAAGVLSAATGPTGAISWSAAEPQLLQLAWKYGTCALAQVWDDLTGQSPNSGQGSASAVVTTAGSNAPTSKMGVRYGGKVLPKFDAAQMNTEFESIRAKVAPGQSFRIASGVK